MKIKGNLLVDGIISSQGITISGTGQSNPGFYGIIFRDGETIFRDDTIRFNPNDFYLSEEGSKPQLNLVGGSSGGETNTASNLGAGSGIFAQKVGVDLQFKSLTAGSNITLTPSGTEIQISSSGGAANSGFYGISVDVGGKSFSNINKLNFFSPQFYLGQNSPNTDEVVINFRTDPYVEPWTNVILGGEFTTSLAADTAVPGLNFTPAANSRYLVEAFLLLRTTSATVGPRPGFSWPTGTIDGGGYMEVPASATTTILRTWGPLTTANAASTGVPDTTNSHLAFGYGYFITGSSPSGTFGITLNTETAATAVSIRQGSFIRYRKIT